LYKKISYVWFEPDTRFLK